MATVGPTKTTAARLNPAPVGYPPFSKRLDALCIFFSIWLIIGLFIDGLAHKEQRVDTFFSPWHAVLYSGFLGITCLIGTVQLRNMYRHYPLTKALPRGYFPALLGILLFSFAAPLDFMWHEWFGFELRIDALFSPPHLMIISGAMLFGTAPLRTAWIQTQAGARLHGWRDLGPMVMSLFFLMAAVSFFTQYASPIVNAPLLSEPYVATTMSDIDLRGISTGIITTLVLIGVLLLSLRFWPLPFGAMTLLLGGSTALIWFVHNQTSRAYWSVVVWAAIVGLLSDLAMHGFKINQQRPLRVRLLCSLLPAGFFLGYYLIIMASIGLNWITHMWTGMVFEVAILGFCLSLIAIPPYARIIEASTDQEL
ncbi:hypothetical protein [Herpetosiphon sp. NSE202]|uniref:hypothetical protein n=1 Tax=Herpetosiphon sp. NSE202 TaxID=3351349 RepID=UPI0036452A65